MDDVGPVTPAWEKEDKQRLIPISDKTRKGIVDPVVEEGLFTLGKPAHRANQNAALPPFQEAELVQSDRVLATSSIKMSRTM
jgi:hypothetical protein